MSATTNAAEGAVLSNEDGSQGDGQNLYWSEPKEPELSRELSFHSAPLLDIPDQQCLVWPAPAKSQGTHHASFGDNGTTASVSRYGDMMQVTRFFGEEGTSGVFTMDHIKTHRPDLVSERALDLENLSETSYGNYSYGLFMDGWPTTDPTSVKWVNWKWPRFEWQTNDMKTVFQYYVHDGIVLHQLLFHNKGIEDPSDLALKQEPRLSGKMRIQDVDCLSWNSQDEQNGPKDEESEPEHAGPCGFGRVKSHPDHRVMAVMDVFVDGRRRKFSIGENVTLEPLAKDATREIVVAYRLSLIPPGSVAPWHKFMIPAAKANVGQMLQAEITDMGSTCLNPRALVLPWLDSVAQDTTQVVLTDRGDDSEQGGRGDTDMQLRVIQYLTARHLEHILSVCAIPVASLHENRWAPTPVALTCGDMSGHRICTSASYYAFLYLIECERRLAKVGRVSGIGAKVAANIDSLRRRIRTTCKGHIVWLHHVWRKANPKAFTSGHFVANYWATGERQARSTSNIWQPSNSVTDTAFQILKITEYASVYKKEPSFQTLLTKVFVAWLHDLDRLDPREKFAWPRPKQDGVDTFRLEDHFWVWKALKSMESQGMWSLLPKPKRSTPNAGKWDTKEEQDRWKEFDGRVGCSFGTEEESSPLYDKFFLITRRLIPREVQRGILQRFTTLNDVSGRRALAVNRSSKETQFLLHDRDSAMLYDQDSPNSFFPDESFKELWQQTLNSQPHHPANEESAADSKWYTVMRYALSIMMGARGSTLNSMTASNALSSSFKLLLNLFSHNAFLGEQLSWLTKEPVIFDDVCDRDSHFHASFEVIYVLLTHAEHAQPEVEGKKDSNKGITQPGQLLKILGVLEDMSSALKGLPDGLANIQRQRLPRTMEERMPFNNHVVSSNVWSIGEEWLYNYPEFFLAPEREDGKISSGDENARSCDHKSKAMIIDAKKQKQYGKPRKLSTVPQNHSTLEVLTYNGLKEKIGMPRRAGDAKKRFIWLPNANREVARISLAAHDSEAEKEALRLFFHRHFQREKLVQDDTSLALNAWNSELHISFQCLVVRDRPNEGDVNSPCLPNNDKGVFYSVHDPSAAHAICLQPQGEKGNGLHRASISYRFNGDLFDRYWTCHFIESSPTQQVDQVEEPYDASATSPPPSLSSALPSPSSQRPSHHGAMHTYSSPIQGSDGECESCSFLSQDDRKSIFAVLGKDKQGFKMWWQRKILELLLLQRMLDKVIKNTGSILHKIKSSLPDEEKEKSIALAELQTTWNSWLDFVDILETIEDDLTSTLDTLHLWDERAKNHGVEKSRWTLNDENKYRRRIRKERVSVDRRRSDIQEQRQKAKSLQKRLKEAVRRVQTRLKEDRKTKSDNEEKKRAAREHQSERNIRWFTYVTIVFAPLSFAEGFYSMGGAPPYDLTRSLVIFSAVALVITVFLLFGAIKTFSALKKKREDEEYGSNSKSRKTASVSKEKAEQKASGNDDKDLPSLWSLLMSTILNHLARAILYPMRVWESEGIHAKTLPSLILGFVLGLIISPVFITVWLIQFSMLNARDLYLLLKKLLYIPPRVPSEVRSVEEAGTPKDQPGHFAMQPPRILERFLKYQEDIK